MQSQIHLINEMCEQAVVGSSPFDVEAIWHKIYTQPHDYRSPSLTSTPALSAIEMALWDIAGKATGQPIYNLLGGKFRDQLRAYAYLDTAGVWENPELAGEREPPTLSNEASESASWTRSSRSRAYAITRSRRSIA